MGVNFWRDLLFVDLQAPFINFASVRTPRAATSARTYIILVQIFPSVAISVQAVCTDQKTTATPQFTNHKPHHWVRRSTSFQPLYCGVREFVSRKFLKSHLQLSAPIPRPTRQPQHTAPCENKIIICIWWGMLDCTILHHSSHVCVCSSSETNKQTFFFSRCTKIINYIIYILIYYYHQLLFQIHRKIKFPLIVIYYHYIQ